MARPGCPEEDQPQGDHEFGVVGDAEAVVYALIEPRTSRVGSVVYFTTNDWKERQISICRAKVCSYAAFYDQAVAGQVAKGSAYKGFVWATAGEIRNINAVNDKGEVQPVGAVCVIDDALDGFPSHARMGECRPDTKFWAKHQRLAARMQLTKVMLGRGVFTEAGAPFPTAEAC